jgi:pyruvate,water dikinase
MANDSILWFDSVGMTDVATVGGKNASLGEMTSKLSSCGIRVPIGFATTAGVYRDFLAANRLEAQIGHQLALYHSGKSTLHKCGQSIRTMIRDADFLEASADAIRSAYDRLAATTGVANPAVAVRSSATAEDMPEASFAGQQESFLNVHGHRALLDACRRCFASLFTDRAISYRDVQGYDHLSVALSIGVQQMVRSDLAGSGVMFSIDTENGNPNVVVISAAWGLGETVVQGQVDPDEYIVFKPLLEKPEYRPIIGKRLGKKALKMRYARGGSRRTETLPTTTAERDAWVLDEEEILQLARWAVTVEQHYGRPMDIEWAKDGKTGDIFLVQARPETVHANRAKSTLTRYWLKEKATPLVRGIAIGSAIASGRACLVPDARDIAHFRDGDILVTSNTDPDWVPIMKRAAGIITDHGGATSHAAIVSRELGVPALVGTGDATSLLRQDQMLTLSCAEGQTGSIYNGAIEFGHVEIDLGQLPETDTAMMVNLADPDAAFQWWQLPAKGVGLARMEFIINAHISAHPMALLHPERITSDERRQIEKLARGYARPADYFVETLARGIAALAAPYYPHPAIIRLSDFKTNEYAHLLGGAAFEPEEENPMLGFRGASRYYNPRYREGFALECRAIKRARELLGFANVIVMVPFCRTLAEADRVLAEMAENGLQRGTDGLQVYMMCEIPSNVILAERFAQRFDGFSIGSNDLTQLVLGVDRDSEVLAALFDERDDAVLQMIAGVIAKAHSAGVKIGICGQAPSDYPEFAAFLVKQGIDSISLNPDSFVRTIEAVAKAEADRRDFWKGERAVASI